MDGEQDACLRLVSFAVSFAVSFIMGHNDFMVAYYVTIEWSKWGGMEGRATRRTTKSLECVKHEREGMGNDSGR